MGEGHKREDRNALLVLTAFACILWFEQIFLGPYSIVRWHDAFDSSWMYVADRGKLLLEHGLYAWDPHFAGGLPSFTGHLQPYYLQSFLMAFMPPWLFYSLLRLLATILSAYGAYRLTRELLGAPRYLALMGGVSFTLYASQINIHCLFNYIFPLFVVWFLDLYRDDIGRLAKAGLVLGLVIISHLSLPVLTVPFFPAVQLGLVLFYYWNSPRLKAMVLGVFVIWAAYILIYVPNLYALLEFTSVAHRTYQFAQTGLAQTAAAFLELFFDTAFFKWYASAFFVLALPVLRNSPRLKTAALFLLVPALAYSMYVVLKPLLADTFIIKMDLAHMSWVLPVGQLLFLVTYLMELRRSPGLLSAWHLLAALAILGTVTAAGLMASNVLLLNLFYLAGGLGLVALVTPHRSERTLLTSILGPAVAVTVLVVSMTGIVMLHKVEHFKEGHKIFRISFPSYPALADIARQHQDEPFRVACVNNRQSLAHSYGLDTAGNRGALFYKSYKKYFKEIIRPQLDTPEKEHYFDHSWYDLSSGWKMAYGPKGQILASNWNLALLAAINVKYILSDVPLGGGDGYLSFYAKTQGGGPPFDFLKGTELGREFTSPLWIYRLKGRLGLGYLAKEPVMLLSDEAVLSEMTARNAQGLGGKVFFNSADLPSGLIGAHEPTSSALETDSLELVSHSPDRLEYKGRIESPAFVVVANNFDPKWTAMVNGKAVPVLRANHAFQAVYLDQPGQFHLVLEYKSPLVWWLHLVSAVGLLLFGVLWFLGVNSRKNVIPVQDEATPRYDQDLAPWTISYPRAVLVSLLTAQLMWAWLYNTVPCPYPEFINSKTLFCWIVAPIAGVMSGVWVIFWLRRLSSSVSIDCIDRFE